MTTPTIVAAVSLSGQSAPIASSALLAFGTPAGLYQVKGYLALNAAGGPDLSIGLTWGDNITGGNAGSHHKGFDQHTRPSLFTTIDQILCSDGTGVSFEVDQVGGGTCPTFGLELTVIQLF